MSAEQKEEVAENIATTVNRTHAELINAWGSIQQLLIEIAMTGLDHEKGRELIKNKTSTRLIIEKLMDEKILPADLSGELIKIQLSRDIIVHNVDAELNDSVIDAADQAKHLLIELLEELDEQHPAQYKELEASA